ncbi:MAG: hypothetical protein GXP58_06050 [Deltaproteobacteria bacterium]|nr:hypothetical protein [Deltaproteobacteria bacterium]
MLRNKVFFLLLIVSVFFAVYRNYTFFRKRFHAMTPSAMASLPVSPDRVPGEKKEDKVDGLSTADRLRFAAGAGRDPFVLPGGETFAVPQVSSKTNRLPRLNAVLWSRGRRVALLDGEIHQEGENISGHRILRIEPDRVILAGGGGEVMIELKKGETP